MKRYILTGAPGAGKTAILRSLEADGHSVIEEAATDVIASEQSRGVDEPWADPLFPERICDLQRQRQREAATRADDVQFYDRSPICTLALATYLGHPVSPGLERELGRIDAEQVYRRQVFFIQLLGFITPSAARRIDLADAIAFEQVHLKVYRDLGYTCVQVPPAPVRERADSIREIVE